MSDDEQALLIAMPLRHLESAMTAGPRVVLPAGGPGDLDAATPRMRVVVIATEAGDDEVPAATWGATFVRRVPYEPGSPWPEAVPVTWLAEHDPSELDAVGSRTQDDDPDDDPGDDEDVVGPQSFLEVEHLNTLRRRSWLFTNELVRKQARRGRSFRPREPTIVDLPD